MFKITEIFKNGKTVRLRLDGTLSNDAFGELSSAWLLHSNGPQRTVILDMAGIEFMNDQAARELINMRGERLRIINCSPFIATLLDTIAKEKTGELNKDVLTD